MLLNLNASWQMLHYIYIMISATRGLTLDIRVYHGKWEVNSWQFCLLERTTNWTVCMCMYYQTIENHAVHTLCPSSICCPSVMIFPCFLYEWHLNLLVFETKANTPAWCQQLYILTLWGLVIRGVTIHLVTIRFVLRYTACDILHDTIFAMHISDILFIQELSICEDLGDRIYG